MQVLQGEHRDVYVDVLSPTLKLKGIGVLCSSLRDVCPPMRTRGRFRLSFLLINTFEFMFLFIGQYSIICG